MPKPSSILWPGVRIQTSQHGMHRSRKVRNSSTESDSEKMGRPGQEDATHVARHSEAVGEVAKRVLKVLDHEGPDRLPVFDTFWEEFVSAWRRERSVPDRVDIRDYYFIDIAIAVPDEVFFPSRRRVIESREGCVVEDDGWGRIVKRRQGAYFYQVVRRELDERSSLEGLQFDPPDMDLRYRNLARFVEAETKRRCVFCKIGGPFIRSTFIRGTRNLATDMIRHPAFAADLFHAVGGHLLSVALEALKRTGLHENGVWIYDDMCSNRGPMFSPRLFRDLILPVYERMIKRLRAAGCRKIILHCDGDLRPLLDSLMDAGIDGIHPVEPRAGMDATELRKQYGDQLALIGGVDNTYILPRGQAGEVESHIRSLCEIGREGGFIIGTHSIGPDVTVSRYELYRRYVACYGTYE